MFSQKQTEAINKAFETLSFQYCNSLPKPEQLPDFEPRGKYKRKINWLLKSSQKAYYPLINTTLKRAACACLTLLVVASTVIALIPKYKEYLMSVTDQPQNEPIGESSDVPLNDFIESDDNVESIDKPLYEVVESYCYAYSSVSDLEKKCDVICVAEVTGNTNQIIPDKVEGEARPTVCTDYTLKVIGLAKGEKQDKITVRLSKGQIGDTYYWVSNEPNFEKGKKYFLMLEKGTPYIKNDITYYQTTSRCYELDQNNNLIVSLGDDEDGQRIKELLNEALKKLKK